MRAPAAKTDLFMLILHSLLSLSAVCDILQLISVTLHTIDYSVFFQTFKKQRYCCSSYKDR